MEDFHKGGSLEIIMKAVMLGEYASGKTTLCYCLRNGRNPQVRCQTTIGVEFNLLEWKLDPTDPKRSTKIQLFDTAGMEKYMSITQSYFRTANVFIIVADSTKTFDKEWEKTWVDACQEVATGKDQFPRKTILVASKIDQLAERDLNFNETIQRLRLLATTRGFYFMISTTENVPNMVDDMCVIMGEVWSLFEKHAQEQREKERNDRVKPMRLKPKQDDLDGWAIEHRCQC